MLRAGCGVPFSARERRPADSAVKSTNCHVIAAGRGLQRAPAGRTHKPRCYSDYVLPPAKLPNSGKIHTVFLDRDGVINEKAPEGQYVRSPQELYLLAGAPEAVARLNGAGLRTIVVSNQRGIAKGLYTAADVEAIHSALQKKLGRSGARLDAFFYCPHEKGECQCRKPLPGMFEQALNAFPQIKAAESVMVGDSLVDVQFGRGLGMPTILIEGDAKRHRPDLAEAVRLADWRVSSLPEAVCLILDGHC